MRTFTLAACLALVAPSMAIAQTAPTAAAKYSVDETDLGTLMDNTETRAVLEKYIPEMLANEQIKMARGMTLKALQQYAGDLLTDEKLAKINADLAKVQGGK